MTKLLQFTYRQHVYRLIFKKSFFWLCLFFFCLFCYLGHWQLQRYTYKKALLLSYATQMTAQPVPFARFKEQLTKRARVGDKLQFQNVRVQGEYQNSLNMFIQNKKYQEQMGFEVLTPLKLPGEKKLLLVDRGWIPETKNHLPTPVKTVTGEINSIGYIKLLNEHQFILGKNILSTSSPLIMQKIAINEIEKITKQEFYPFVLRLNPAEEHGFVRNWTITVSPPERHMGYAVQWFAMALVLLIAFLSFSIERAKK